MASDKLVISLLGPPEIKVGNKVLQIKRRMFRYILFYLACHPEPSSRESLCDLFWPLKTESISRKNLREVISKLRRDLPVDDLFITEKEYVSLNKEKVDVDVLKFDEVIALVREHLDESTSGKIPEHVFIAVQDALRLWRADRFLGGVSTSGSAPFQHWIADTAENLQYWRQMMLEWLADRCIVNGSYKEAINWLSQARYFDKTNTEINSLMLTCFRDLNLWSEALHFCSLIESDYDANDELEIPVSLRDLMDHIREDSKKLHFQRLPNWSNDDRLSNNFVGRSDYFVKMEKVANQGGVLLIRGERGSGKSALLKKFFEELQIIPRLLYHNANAGEEKKQYSAIVEFFRQGITADGIAALDPADALTLLPLFPEILKLREDLNLINFSQAKLDDRLIPDAFLNLFKLSQPRKKNLLIIDNAQWLDGGSLAIISRVQRHLFPGIALSMIMTTRSDIKNDALDQFMQQDFRGQIAEELDLQPHDENDIAEMVHHAFNKTCPPELSSELRKLSGGNSRYLALMIDQLKERKFDPKGHQLFASDLIKGDLKKVIKTNLSLFNNQDMEVLKSLSLLRDCFSPDLINQVADVSGRELSQTIKQLCENNILEVVESPRGVSEYQFVHGIEAIYLRDFIDPLARKVINTKIAQAIIRTEGNGEFQAATLAYHLQEAGDLREALKYWIKAAIWEKTKNNYESADRYFRIAQELIRKLGTSADREQFYSLIKEWGDLAETTNDYSTFLSIFEYCLLEGEKRKDQRLIGMARNGFGWMAHVRGHHEIADEFFRQAILTFEQNGNVLELMETYIHLGIHYFSQQDFVNAGEVFDQLLVLTITEKSSQAISAYKKYAALSIYVYCVLGKIKAAKEALAHSEVFPIGATGSREAVEIKVARLNVDYYAGNLLEIKQQGEELLAQIQANGLDWWECIFQIVNGQAAYERGDINYCWKVSQIVLDMNNSVTDNVWRELFSNYLRAGLHYQLGNYAKAESYFLRNAEINADEFMALLTKLGLTKVNILLKRFQHCKQDLEEIIQRAGDHGFEAIAQGAMLEKLNLELALENRRHFSNEFKEVASFLEKSEFIDVRTMRLEIMGRAYEQIGEKEISFEYFQNAFTEATAHQFFWVRLAALKGLRGYDDSYRSILRELKRKIEKEEIASEIPELVESMEAWRLCI